MESINSYRNIEEYYNSIHTEKHLILSNPVTIKRANHYTKVGFVHIGKCGGTEVLRHLKPEVKEIHWEEDPSKWQDYNTKWIIWVRNPFARFVSAFWYSYNGINIPCESIVSCPHAPIQQAEKNGYPSHTSLQKRGFKIFSTPNELAESLYSPDKSLSELAQNMLTNGGEHLPCGLSYYLDDGKWLENNSKILFVGLCENMEKDIIKMKQKLGDKLCWKNKEIKHSRKAKVGNKYLSTKAVSNLKKFWRNTELKTVYKLYTKNYIDFDTFLDYNTYKYIV
jgi:hypothetical protein